MILIVNDDYAEQGYLEALLGDYTINAYLNSGVHEDYWSYEVYNVAGVEIYVEKSTNLKCPRDCLVSGIIKIEEFIEKYELNRKNNK